MVDFSLPRYWVSKMAWIGDLTELTWLESACNLVGSTADVLGGGLPRGLLGLRGNLLLDLLTETFAPVLCQ